MNTGNRAVMRVIHLKEYDGYGGSVGGDGPMGMGWGAVGALGTVGTRGKHLWESSEHQESENV